MADDWDEYDDVVVAEASCPTPDCGGLVIAYRTADPAELDNAEPWEFTCPHCGIEFTVPEEELMFQLVPKERLLEVVKAA